MALLRLNRHPTRAQLYVFSGAWAVACVGLGIALRLRGFGWTSEALTAVGALMPLLAWRAPGAVRVVYLALTYGTYPVGFIVSHLVLVLLYFGLFTPIGLIMRACGRDPLQRRFDRAARTYWERRPPAPAAETYLRQR